MEKMEGLVRSNLNSNITLEDYIQCVLINNKVRRAYLIQNFEDNNALVEERISSILDVFPKLHIKRHYNYNFISFDEIKQDIIDETFIAELLGFYCEGKFEDLDRNDVTYDYNIILLLQKGKKIEELNLITYICQRNSKSEISYADSLTKSIKMVLLNDDLIKSVIKNVILDITENKPSTYLTNILSNMQHVFIDSDIDKVSNMIYNTFPIHLEEQLTSKIDYTNPIHRGIILCIQSQNENDVLSPFYPLQTSPYNKEFNDIMESQVNFIENILISTQINNEKQSGGKKRNNNTKKRNKKRNKQLKSI